MKRLRRFTFLINIQYCGSSLKYILSVQVKLSIVIVCRYNESLHDRTIVIFPPPSLSSLSQAHVVCVVYDVTFEGGLDRVRPLSLSPSLSHIWKH